MTLEFFIMPMAMLQATRRVEINSQSYAQLSIEYLVPGQAYYAIARVSTNENNGTVLIDDVFVVSVGAAIADDARLLKNGGFLKVARLAWSTNGVVWPDVYHNEQSYPHRQPGH